ncbi:MAG: aromatic amino acid lyase, partial [Advenella sp.]
MHQSQPPFILGSHDLRIEDVLQVMRKRSFVTVGPDVAARLDKARLVVDRYIKSGQPAYGLTTALGANVGKPIAPSELRDYQTRAIVARSVGMGEAASEELVRGLLFSRLASLSVGKSGISSGVFHALLALLNSGICPVVPRIGSIGVADLPAMSHAMLVLLGQGRARVDGQEMAGDE